MALQNYPDGSVYCDFLIVARRFSRQVVVRREQPLDNLARNVVAVLEALPQFVRGREVFQRAFETGREIMLHNSVTVGGVREFDAQDLGIFFCLAETISRFLVISFRFYYGDSKIRSIPQEIIGPLLFTPYRAIASDHDAAIGEGPLLVNVVVSPAGSVQLRQDVLSACIGFS